MPLLYAAMELPGYDPSSRPCKGRVFPIKLKPQVGFGHAKPRYAQPRTRTRTLTLYQSVAIPLGELGE